MISLEPILAQIINKNSAKGAFSGLKGAARVKALLRQSRFRRGGRRRPAGKATSKMMKLISVD